jgi:type IV secretory pathway VirB2 component (pilin)
MRYNKFELKSEQIWQMFFVMCALVVIISIPDFASASGGDAPTASPDDGISGTLCRITTQLTGSIGRGIATIAVVVLGVGLFLGKLSWGLAMATALGIGMIFSAAKIAAWLSGSATTSCSTS